MSRNKAMTLESKVNVKYILNLSQCVVTRTSPSFFDVGCSNLVQ